MKNRKHSRKREAILGALRSTKTHPSAEWIYAQLKPLYPDLSLGTVYRNLSLFREEGRIISVGTVNGQERFDADTSPHAHFVCDRCGAVIDMDVEFAFDPCKAASAFSEGSIDYCEVVCHGRCHKCIE